MLASALDHLAGFTFSYQSHFHHRVRGAMNPLDPMAARIDANIQAIIERKQRAEYTAQAELQRAADAQAALGDAAGRIRSLLVVEDG